MGGILSIIQSLIVLAGVLILAYISLRLVNRYTVGQTRMIRIVERLGVNNNSALAIVEVCGKYYLMSLTQDDNTILRDLDQEEIEEVIKKMDQEQEPEARMSTSLKNIFSRQRKI